VELEPEEVVEAPWEALAAVATGCPGAPNLQLVQSARPHWENDRLNFNQSSRQIRQPSVKKSSGVTAIDVPYPVVRTCSGCKCIISFSTARVASLYRTTWWLSAPAAIATFIKACCRLRGRVPKRCAGSIARDGTGHALEGLAEPITFEEEFLHWLTSVPLLE